MAKITFDNKQQYEALPNVPEDKKMTWRNVNEIKDSVNAIYEVFNDFPEDGKTYGVKDGSIKEIDGGSGGGLIPYPVIVANGDTNLEEAELLSFRFTFSGTIEKIILANFDESDGDDIIVRLRINGNNHLIVIDEGENVVTYVPPAPIVVETGHKCRVEVMQIGSIESGKGLTADFKFSEVIEDE